MSVGRRVVGPVEVWDCGAARRVLLGTASTIRGAQQLVRRRPGVVRVLLRGTASALDRANGQSHVWSLVLDLRTRDVPVDYEVVREGR